jgi:hypothetical protein
MKTKLLSVAALAALLTACGGGGGSTPQAQAQNTNATITAAASATKATLGATDLGTSTTQVYDVAADIGDTWRITFNTVTNAYSIAVLNTVYGLSGSSTGATGTYTSSTTGNLTTYTLSGNAGNVSIDSRTKDISGKMTIGGKSSTVAGTSTAVTDLTKLAGTYNFMGAARNVSDGGSASAVAGQMKINADGATATICEEGTFNTAGVCDSGNPSSPTVSHAMTLRIDNSNATMPKIRMEFVTPEYQTEKDFGIVNVQAGDLGAALVIDRFGHNAAGILRTGVFYAAKVQQLTGSNSDGTWKCSQFGVDRASLVLTTTNGSTSNVITDSSGASHTENIYWNKVADASSSTGVTLNGFAVSVAGSSAVNILPLSSSLAVAEIDNASGLTTCRKQ